MQWLLADTEVISKLLFRGVYSFHDTHQHMLPATGHDCSGSSVGVVLSQFGTLTKGMALTLIAVTC